MIYNVLSVTLKLSTNQPSSGRWRLLSHSVDDNHVVIFKHPQWTEEDPGRPCSIWIQNRPVHRLKLLYPADPARLLFGLARSVIPTWFLGPYISWPDPYILGKGKGNIDLYNSSSQTPLMCSDMDHTVLSANNTISAFTRKLSPGVATMRLHIAKAWVYLTTHLSTPRGMAELAMLADIQRTASRLHSYQLLM